MNKKPHWITDEMNYLSVGKIKTKWDQLTDQRSYVGQTEGVQRSEDDRFKDDPN